MYFYGNCVQLSDDSNFNYFLTMNAIRIVFEGTPFKGGTSNIVTEIEVFQRYVLRDSVEYSGSNP